MKTSALIGTSNEMAHPVRQPVQSIAELVTELQARGRYTLTRQEALASLPISEPVLSKAVVRLSAKGRICVPRRGFYVIVPLEYKSAGSPPPEWFVDDLMRFLGKRYYVGALSAASVYGAAHQQPQEFQVITEAPQRPIRVGRVRIRFLVRRNMERVTLTAVKTGTGTMSISTRETTALDLLRYAHAVGGLGNAATVLADMAEGIDPRKLVEVIRTDGEMAYAQRLGYLLEMVGAGDLAACLAQEIEERNPRVTPLRPDRPSKGSEIHRRWRVIVNDTVEADR